MAYNQNQDANELFTIYEVYTKLVEQKKLEDAPIKLEEEDWKNLLGVSAYLAGGPDSVREQLKKLDGLMQSHPKVKALDDLLTKGAAYFKDWATRHDERQKLAAQQKAVPANDSPFAKLLTSILAEAEGKQGFKPADYPTYLGVLSAVGFTEEGKKGRHFKDLVSPRHGEYTHRLQWYLCMQEGLFGKRLAGQVFAIVARVFQLWDHLFDRNDADTPFVHGKFDFRKPEFFNDWLCNDAQLGKECPLLTAFLKARREKRETLMTTANKDAYLKDYVARKKYGRLYKDLAEEPVKLKEVDAILKARLLTRN
jgi:hypothetical protein